MEPPKLDLCRLVIPVSNMAKSGVFYGRVLGLHEVGGEEVKGKMWFEWANEVVLGISQEKKEAVDAAPDLKLLLRVENLDEVETRLADGRVKYQPRQTGDDHLVVYDPDGNRILIIEGRGISARMISRTEVVGDRLQVIEEAIVKGRPELVWSAFTDDALLSAWFCGGPVSIEPQRGGRLELTFPHIGRPHTTWICKIIDIIPPARLRFIEEDIGLEVTIDVAPMESTRSLVRIAQAPIKYAEFTDDPRAMARSMAMSWRRTLRRLAQLMDDELDGEEPGDDAGGGGES